jgi:hypothetical protein
LGKSEAYCSDVFTCETGEAGNTTSPVEGIVGTGKILCGSSVPELNEGAGNSIVSVNRFNFLFLFIIELITGEATE